MDVCFFAIQKLRCRLILLRHARTKERLKASAFGLRRVRLRERSHRDESRHTIEGKKLLSREQRMRNLFL